MKPDDDATLADIVELVAALRFAINDADGWCDEARGVPSPNLNMQRALVAKHEEAMGDGASW